MAIGLAGFSGVLIVLTRPGGGFNPPEQFRLRVLVYSSMGALFLALSPFAVLDSGLAEETGWRVLGFVLALYAGYGIVSLPPTSFRLRREYPDLFPLGLILIQLAVHITTFGLAIVLCLGITSHFLSVYTAGLILVLAHGAIAFVRLLFYRRH